MDGHIGNFAIKDNEAYFARSPILSNKDEITGNSDLYTARFNKNVVANVKPLPNWINTYYGSWESHPSISSDGNVLFFSSDRIPYKGPDIFFTIRLPNGEWSQPINCGDSINTECDEITPFVTKDGKYLLFSSTGHENVGGYDLFISNISNEFWKEVKKLHRREKMSTFQNFLAKQRICDRQQIQLPMKFIHRHQPTQTNCCITVPISSVCNLVYIDGEVSIFTVDTNLQSQRKLRKLKSQKKIGFEIKEEVDVTPKVEFDPNFKLYGYVYSAESNLPIKGANVYVYQFDTLTQEFPDVTKVPPMFSTKTKDNGYYEFSLLKNIEYQLFAEASNFFYDMKRLRLEFTEPEKEKRLDFYLPLKLTLRINFPFDVYDNPYKFVLDTNGLETNITWEEAVKMLAMHIINNSMYIKKIVLVGHTDDVGTEEYNLRLGKNRVDFIIKQLVKLGVSPEILEGQSAGESQPLPRRPDEDLTTYRKRLRRVEILKIY